MAHRRYPRPVQTGRITRSTIPQTRESNQSLPYNTRGLSNHRLTPRVKRTGVARNVFKCILRPIRVVYESVCIRDVRDRRQMTGRTPIRRNRKKLGTGNPRGGANQEVVQVSTRSAIVLIDRSCTSRGGARSRALCTCTALRPLFRAPPTHVTSSKTRQPPLQTTRDSCARPNGRARTCKKIFYRISDPP